MAAKTILIVEDELDVLELLRRSFEAKGFRTLLAQDGKGALQHARRRLPDLILLDLLLPDMDGMDVCRELRRDPAVRHVPIVMLTSRKQVSDVILGFESGADDYLRKPLKPREVVARVSHLLQRSRSKRATLSVQEFSAGDLTIDPRRFEVRMRNATATLTPTEFRILQLLAGEPGRVFSRGEILDAAVGSLVSERNVDSHVNLIRRKLGSAARRIQTIRGVGYRFSEASA